MGKWTETPELAAQAAEEVGLNPWTRAVYLKYVTTRFPGRSSDYLFEWAERFAGGFAWSSSDLEGQELLRKIVGPGAEKL